MKILPGGIVPVLLALEEDVGVHVVGGCSVHGVDSIGDGAKVTVYASDGEVVAGLIPGEVILQQGVAAVVADRLSSLTVVVMGFHCAITAVSVVKRVGICGAYTAQHLRLIKTYSVYLPLFFISFHVLRFRSLAAYYGLEVG